MATIKKPITKKSALAEELTSQQAESIGLPTSAPIAVVDEYGHVLPFTQNNVDAFHLVKMGVTYLYTKEEVQRAVEHNANLIRSGNFEAPSMFHGTPKLILPRQRQLKETDSQIKFIDPIHVAVPR